MHKYKPGPGWTFLAGSVWEHQTGVRIHVDGLVRMPDKSYHYLNQIDDGAMGRRCIRINGGNRKRGLMAWARILVGA